MYEIRISPTTLAMSSIAAACIVLGVTMTDSDLERKRKSLGKKYPHYHSIGIILFALGWVLFAASASIQEKQWYPILGSLGVFGAAMISQKLMQRKPTFRKENVRVDERGFTRSKTSKMIGALLFVLSWVGLSISMAIDRNKNWRWDKFFSILAGALLVIISMGILIMDRVRPVPNIYSLGLPLFTIGWSILAVSTASK